METDFDELEGLKRQWEALQPLDPECEARLWKKLRLEWSYHSNHIEGNTLTYGETELLLIHGQTSGNHDLREFEEMKAHVVAIEYVVKLAKDSSRPLSESDVRDINQILLKEPYWKYAETADGQSTRKEIVPGRYKTSPNSVRTATGEMFEFASVEETPPRMQRLVDWVRAELESPTLHPVEIASRFHHEFVLIHPFDDGNGRTARILANYILMRFGYLPVIVRTEEKAAYLSALRLADAGEPRSLVSYLARCAVAALELGIKAAKGESLEEPSDIEKEIALFVREQAAGKRDVVPISPGVLEHLYEMSWRSIFERFRKKALPFSELFATSDWSFPHKNRGILESAFMRFINDGPTGNTFQMTLLLKGYHAGSKNIFDYDCYIAIQFAEFEYALILGSQNGPMIRATKLYSEPILFEESEKMLGSFLKQTLAEIKSMASR